VWVHDYQLQLVPRMLRQLRPDLRIGFFLHIPFPPVELFSQLPWRRQVLEGLLGADLIGFQTKEGALNFLRLVQRFLALRPGGDRVVVDELSGSRTVRADAFPIGIRAQDFAELAERPETQERARQIRTDLGKPELILLGVDRLDYTKGIDVRIRAVTELFQDEELDPNSTVFVQVATPSRENVEEYQKIRDDVELLVSRANGDIGKLGVTPIHYLHQPMPRDELAAMYSTADVMLVTPMRDGMNLVAKEYVACRTNEDGGLVLSEFTGAAYQMSDAWLVNPYDIDGVKRSIIDAVRAAPEESHRRMLALRHSVFEEDVERWANDFLSQLEDGR
jgi:trehalose 6-phosphate synthase